MTSPTAAVELLDDITADTATARATIARTGHARHMDVVRCEIEEERVIFVFLNEAVGFAGKRIGNRFVVPACRFAAAHKANAADTVHDRAVVALRELHFKHFRMLFARGLVADSILAIADFDWVVWIEANDPMVFYVNARHAIAGRRHDETVIEADFQGSRPNLAIPIDFFLSQAKMPLADGCAGISGGMQHGRQCRPARFDDQCGIAGQNARPLLSPRILAGQQPVAARCAGGGGRMRIGESQSLRGKLFEVRRFDFCCARNSRCRRKPRSSARDYYNIRYTAFLCHKALLFPSLLTKPR